MNTIKRSLMIAYADDPVILNMIEQLDLTALQVQYEQEMYARISFEDVKLAEAMLTSDIITRYNKAIEETTLALTRPIRDLMIFTLQEKSGEEKLN